MKRILSLFLLCALFSCTSSVLPKDSWDPNVRKSLVSLIKDYGIKSKNYNPACPPYVVLDFDNTSIVGDISNNLMTYMVEHLIFGPQNVADGFLTGVPDVNLRFEDSGATPLEISAVLTRDYALLKEKQASGMSLEQIHATDEYLEFRAAFMDLYEGLAHQFEYGVHCLWMPALLSGMPEDEARTLAAEATASRLAEGRHWDEQWVSPDGRFSATAPLGIVITDEMRHLCEALEENGFDIYVCSASLEWIVETLACDSGIGFGLDPAKVYGLRFVEADVVTPEWMEGYTNTWKEGKVECIRNLIAPPHCGHDPLLVAGDSNGDVAMLTAFGGTRHGLIWDRGNSGDIATLALIARLYHNSDRYLVQK